MAESSGALRFFPFPGTSEVLEGHTRVVGAEVAGASVAASVVEGAVTQRHAFFLSLQALQAVDLRPPSFRKHSRFCERQGSHWITLASENEIRRYHTGVCDLIHTSSVATTVFSKCASSTSSGRATGTLGTFMAFCDSGLGGGVMLIWSSSESPVSVIAKMRRWREGSLRVICLNVEGGSRVRS
jgi:hypothetical protein